MQLSTPTLALLLSTLASASPLSRRDDAPQTANFTFHTVAGTTYDLEVLADGTRQLTNHDAKVVSVDINDYNAGSQCVFRDASGAEVRGELKVDTNTGNQSLLFGETGEGEVVGSVSCEGTCVGIYGFCFDPSTGMSLGACCNGVCAADRCRPWNAGNQ